MKKLALLFVLVQSLVFAQGEQRYADGTATDQDGNTYEINPGEGIIVPTGWKGNFSVPEGVSKIWAIYDPS